MTDSSGSPPPSSRVVRWIAAHPVRVAAAVFLVTAISAVPATHLGIDVDVVDLLPDHAPMAAAYRIALQHFGGLDRVFVLIEGSTDLDFVAVQQKLAQRLEGEPEIANVRIGLEPSDEAFLTAEVLPRAPLLLSSDDWLDELARRLTPEALRDRAHTIRDELLAPGGQFSAPWLVADPLGLAPLLDALRPAAAIPIDPLSGTFRSDDGRAALVMITPARAEMDAAGGRKLLARLETAFAGLRAEFGDDLQLWAVGGPLYAAQDEQIVHADLASTVTSSALMCVLILVIASGGWRPPAGGFALVVVGLVWTAAALAFAFGRVSAIGLAFAAVLVGLGVDYWIHAGARFARFIAESMTPADALAATYRTVGPAILSSAATTAAGFAVLAAAHLRPIREIGVTVALGMTAILVATASLGGAVLALQARGRRPGWDGPAWRVLGRAVEAAVGFAERRSRVVLSAAAVVTVVALAGVPRLTLVADLRGLRPANHPTLEAEHQLLERFNLGLDTTRVVVHGAGLDEALERAAAVAAALRSELRGSGSVTSPDAWLPPARASQERLDALRGLDLGTALDRFETDLSAVGIAPRAFRPTLDLLRGLVDGRVDPVAPRDRWPSWLNELVREGPDGVWAAVYVRAPLGLWPDGPPPELVAELERVAPGVAVASATAVGAELRRIAASDLKRLAVVALLVISGVVIVSFKGRLRGAVLSMLPVVLGTLWVLGLWGLIGVRLDVLSLIFVPVLLGIGIDDGLHAVHAAHTGTSRPDLPKAVRETGRAMVLTTLTTTAAFASLGLSHLPSLRAGGLLVGVGVSACLVATLLVLPALAELFLPPSGMSGFSPEVPAGDAGGRRKPNRRRL
jgi:uncharacterized protein